MIELRMAPGDFAQLRFAYSPLSEAINSLYMLHTGRVTALHRRWAETAREQLRGLDTTLLRAIVLPGGNVLTPPFDLGGANTIEHQLQLLEDWPPSMLRAELESLWQGLPMPAAARQTIRIDKPSDRNYDLEGNGLLLIPCVFAGSCLMFYPGSLGLPVLDYRPRGLGTVWDNNGATPEAGDPLTALIGESRTAILRNAELPRTTTDLARELSLSGATISVHLSILRRCGMVTSWRSGRRVLYQRTPLASSILTAVTQPGS
jgi:biotin operon repressor